MAVYVDQLFPVTSGMITGFWAWRYACHMTADTHDELEAMARTLNLDPAWIQHKGRRTEHYDLTRNKRDQAVRSGALCR
jgi:hypothetical protein